MTNLKNRLVSLLVVIVMILVGGSSRAEEKIESTEQPLNRPLREPYLEVIGLVVLCGTVGVSTCFMFDSSEENTYVRSYSEYGFSLSYLPSFIFSTTAGTGFQRIEAVGYVSNLFVMAEHRRGFRDFDGFYSTSFRIGYSFDKEALMPGFAVGLRNVRGGRNSRAVEVYLPVFSNAKRRAANNELDLISLGTAWVFGDAGVKLEAFFSWSHKVSDGFYLTGVLNYFSDYPHPDAEISFGPTIMF